VVPAPTQTATALPSGAKAVQLRRDGKLDDAAAEYQRVINAGCSALAGFAGLGFGLFSMLDMKIDYRDAMISLKFDLKRLHGDMFPRRSYTHH
jgi:hypothetical protein